MGSRWYIGTIRELDWLFPSPLASNVTYARGQLECGGTTGYRHWQLVVNFRKPVRLSAVRKIFPGHWEPTRSDAALAYVWKEDTRVADTQFEIGAKPKNRASTKDWDEIRAMAKSGNLEGIPSDIYIRCYNQLQRIVGDNLQPIAVERTCAVFWGRTETGKSRRAWEEAGMDAYAKDPNTKWWCGYQGQNNIILDEFRGAISISHLLRWLDRYPVRVETKGGSTSLSGSKFWITSNLDPRAWYPEIDEETKLALLRRLNITHFN